MINANEAKSMLKANIQKDEEALKAKVQRFLDEVCEPAVLNAVERRLFSAFVEIPIGMQEHTALITAMLMANGYKAQTRHGTTPSILILWN